MKKEIRLEIEYICNEVCREMKKCYEMSMANPFTTIDLKNGRKTLKKALIYLVKKVEQSK